MMRRQLRKALDPGWSQQLHGLYVSTANNLSGAIKTSFVASQKRIALDTLAAAIEAGRVDDAIEQARIGRTRLGNDPVQREIHAAMNAASDFEVASIATTTGKVVNPLGRHMKRYLDTQTAKRIKAIDDASRQTVSRIIADALKTGRHPYNTAASIKETVGLTDPMARAVSKYRLGLEAKGELPQPTIDKLVSGYSDRLLDARAETIARTETMNAINGARQALRTELMEDGVLPPNQTHTWRTARDERVCTICGPLDGMSIPVGESFPDADTDAPPGHPNCRCIVTLDDMTGATEGEEEEAVE